MAEDGQVMKMKDWITETDNLLEFRKKEENVREEIKLQVIKKEGLLRKFIKIIKNIFRPKTS